MTIHDATFSRRSLLKAGAGLAIGAYIARGGKAFAQTPAATGYNIAPNTFLIVKPDNTVTVLCKNIEFGQGPFTGMATLVAEELDADWSQMRADHAPSNPVLVQEPAVRRAGHRRFQRDRQFLRPDAPGRRCRPSDAGRGRGRELAGVRLPKSPWTAASSGIRPARKASFGEFADKAMLVAGAGRSEVEGPVELQADRQGRRGQAARQRHQVERHGRIHARHQRAGHADRGDRAIAAVRRHGGVVRCDRRESDPGRRRRQTGSDRRRGLRQGLLAGEDRARRA